MKCSKSSFKQYFLIHIILKPVIDMGYKEQN